MRLQGIYNQKINLYRDNLNEFIIKQIGFNQVILDVGCSEGKLGKYLKRHKKAKVFGVDISNEAVKRAKKNLDNVYTLNIETNNLPFPKKSFDVIICADVLEHLYNPLATLKNLKKYLKDNGFFILSIPNFANFSIRWNLLCGRFNYQKSGIADETHLRFFTDQTVRELVNQAGMKILRIDYAPGFSFLFLQGRILRYKIFKDLQYRLAKIRPSLFCTQFIVVAK